MLRKLQQAGEKQAKERANYAAIRRAASVALPSDFENLDE